MFVIILNNERIKIDELKLHYAYNTKDTSVISFTLDSFTLAQNIRLLSRRRNESQLTDTRHTL